MNRPTPTSALPLLLLLLFPSPWGCSGAPTQQAHAPTPQGTHTAERAATVAAFDQALEGLLEELDTMEWQAIDWQAASNRVDTLVVAPLDAALASGDDALFTALLMAADEAEARWHTDPNYLDLTRPIFREAPRRFAARQAEQGVPVTIVPEIIDGGEAEWTEQSGRAALASWQATAEILEARCVELTRLAEACAEDCPRRPGDGSRASDSFPGNDTTRPSNYWQWEREIAGRSAIAVLTAASVIAFDEDFDEATGFAIWNRAEAVAATCGVTWEEPF